MGRYYSGDIEGKFWFSIQNSCAANRFGYGEQENNSIPFYYDKINYLDENDEMYLEGYSIFYPRELELIVKELITLAKEFQTLNIKDEPIANGFNNFEKTMTTFSTNLKDFINTTIEDKNIKFIVNIDDFISICLKHIEVNRKVFENLTPYKLEPTGSPMESTHHKILHKAHNILDKIYKELADLELGLKIFKCLLEQGTCSFEAKT